MRLGLGFVAAGLCGVLCGANAQAAEHGPRIWTAEELAPAIMRDAQASSFAALEDFGRQAAVRGGRAGLDRVAHVAWVLLNQSEFERFNRWNSLLLARARLAGDERYISVAEFDALRARFDQGDALAQSQILATAGKQADWMARMHAMTVAAYVLVKCDRVGEALKMLSDADVLAQPGDPYAGIARARVWEVESLALLNLYDLDGSAVAAGRSQFEMSPAGYPHPDFDSLYNLGLLAARLGRRELADKLYETHHRLVGHTDLKGLKIWDQRLCATVAEAKNAPKQVLRCLEGLGPDLAAAHFVAPQLFSLRAVAYARTGKVRAAERDLQSLEALRKAGGFDPARFPRLPLVRAEVLRAEGRVAEAYKALMEYTDGRAAQSANSFGGGIRQLTSVMERQLTARREQLATAKRNAELQQAVIRGQRRTVAIGALVGVLILGVLVWQLRQGRQLATARRNAEMANLAKSTFLANMSHEIRTPLNGVVAVADMLSRADLKPREHEMVEIIRSSGDNLQRLLADILDLARIESGQIALETAPFHLGDLVRSVAALSQLKCDEKGVALSVRVAPELETMVLGDVVRVRQVLTNFLSNAVKFTERGRITVSAEALPAGPVRFQVEDTGVGFEAASKSKVLARFQQADSSITRRYGGTGLGLSICRDLAELMGGGIDCQSTPGKGSTFWMDLPLPTADTADLRPAKAESAPAVDADEDAPAQVLRVLLADDHPTNRKVVELMLSSVGAEICSVDNGQEALDALEREVFDLVLMDMQMPVMDGLAAVREIRRREREGDAARLPVIMLTANALPEHIRDALAAGADRHLGKPLTAATLFEAIEEVLDGAETSADAPVTAAA